MKATPAAMAVLRQATALKPLRKKLSDGLLPSAAHQVQNPKSDHNTGLAVDLTHDPKGGIDCVEIFEKLKEDKRVDYLTELVHETTDELTKLMLGQIKKGRCLGLDGCFDNQSQCQPEGDPSEGLCAPFA